MKILNPKPFFIYLILFSFVSIEVTAQLGFCGGNSGYPIFTENFGSGNTDGPALPAGTTTYNFTTSTPNDGDYTISSTTNYLDWINIQDHTPGDTNGKSLIVNASFTAGEFYQRQVTGLCENTTYEFSSWLINLLPTINCPLDPEIPVNVRFQIWDKTDTNLLGKGDTGDIFASENTNWQQYALVFKTKPGQNSVILKMINNRGGGCGNDLAIDDIVFKSCGDNVTVSTNTDESNLTVCEDQGAVSRTITATPDNSIFSTHAYQWQQSTDQVAWINIANETSNTLATPPIISTTYFRVKIAEDPINVNNDLCNVVSDVFEITVLPIPNVPTSTGDVAICEGEVGILSASTDSSYTINWYDAPTDGNLLLEGNNNFEIATAGTYYAEANSPEIECASLSRTAITLTVNPLPAVPDDTYTYFCENTTITIDAALDDVTYLWNTGEITRRVEVSEPGEYIIIVTNNNGCANSYTFFIEQIDLPKLESIVSDGPSIIVSTSNTGDFEFSLDGFYFQDSPIFEAVEGGFYTVYVQDKTDCGTVTQTFFHLVIPKFFTPNGDTINDLFELDGLDIFTNVSFSIFDRYGKLLKFGNTNSSSWDGSFQGKDMPEDDYWYNIEADTTQFKGHFSLKR
ncbi:T9SS type B sorting domain-containing protein [Maribacter sp. ACAM166]|uniref:T9SS type B sorting domain-containing protein n=1 Tax=Maribacter sp. ACAM166 TaxID=2508996 RepID=UPI0010FD90F2|nr:T9SS type B sorting domain-containing protein [Maribacter sp. ACAM166]TLP82630.1 T9SS type B sorting domain-containing protein [Maribacter sp. ACAM166]